MIICKIAIEDHQDGRIEFNAKILEDDATKTEQILKNILGDYLNQMSNEISKALGVSMTEAMPFIKKENDANSTNKKSRQP